MQLVSMNLRKEQLIPSRSRKILPMIWPEGGVARGSGWKSEVALRQAEKSKSLAGFNRTKFLA